MLRTHLDLHDTIPSLCIVIFRHLDPLLLSGCWVASQGASESSRRVPSSWTRSFNSKRHLWQGSKQDHGNNHSRQTKASTAQPIKRRQRSRSRRRPWRARRINIFNDRQKRSRYARQSQFPTYQNAQERRHVQSASCLWLNDSNGGS